MASNAVQVLKNDIQRIKDLRDTVQTQLDTVNARKVALQADKDAYTAQIADNQAAITLLGG